MATYRAFNVNNGDYKYRIELFPNPTRWSESFVGEDNPIRYVDNWSPEIKYMTEGKVSDEIKRISKNKGGVYMFYLKGINLPFSEVYILYIGRTQLTATQNICKRAKSYINENRPLIKEMFSRWKDQLYYRYFADTENDRIKSNEAALIRAILPPYNEQIPDKIEIQPEIKAF